MIMVDVTVPSIGRQYNFSLDEQTAVSILITEIAEVICQKENCHLSGEMERLVLCNNDTGKIFSGQESLSEQGVKNGGRLLLI